MSESTQISTRRRNGFRVDLFVDGSKVGEVIKHRDRKYGLFLNGIYWRKGKPTRHGGSTGTGFPSLKGAVEAAGTTLATIDAP